MFRNGISSCDLTAFFFRVSPKNYVMLAKNLASNTQLKSKKNLFLGLWKGVISLVLLRLVLERLPLLRYRLFNDYGTILKPSSHVSWLLQGKYFILEMIQLFGIGY
jgi:hypothetical protein